MARRPIGQNRTGTYTGTGNAVEVVLNFKPKFIKIFNETDGDIAWEYLEGMADASALQYDAAVSLISSNGITVSSHGFTAGTALSESAKVFRYIAF